MNDVDKLTTGLLKYALAVAPIEPLRSVKECPREHNPSYFFANTTGVCSTARMRSKKLRTDVYCSTGIMADFSANERLKTRWPSLTSHFAA